MIQIAALFFIDSMKKKKQTLLWKIESDQLPAASYVFGTMHVRDQRAFGYMDLVKSKIEECDAFATEIDLDAAQTMDPAKMLLPDNQTLDQLLKPKVYKKIDKIIQREMGMKLEHFNRQLPLIVSNTLASNTLRTETPVSLDMALWQYAKRQGKQLQGVESFQEHIEILPKIPLEYQLKALKDIAKDYRKYRKTILKMAKMYQESEIQKLYKATRRSIKGMRKVLLFDRNKIMADSIANMAAQQSTVAAIGAAHLAGKEGVLRLLKKQKLKVKPIQNCPQ